MLSAGAAKVDITPPVGVRMAGFAGRAFPSMGVHDSLWARALVLDDGDRRAALMALDLIGISEEIVARVREAAASSAGLAPHGVLIAATHTHSGPRPAREEPTPQEREYWDSLPGRLVEALNSAAADLNPAAVGAATGWAAVGINRREQVPGGRIELGRNHFGTFDTDLGLLRVERRDGTPLAGLMNYACHAVCLTFDNYLLSADYPAYTVRFFEEMLGGGAMGVFFNGACGNVNPREAAVNHGLAAGGGFFIAERAGQQLAREATRIWGRAAPRSDVHLSFARREIELPTNRPRAIRAAEAALQQAEEQAAEPPQPWTPYVAWYHPPDPEVHRRRLAQLKEEGDSPLRCEIQAIAVGPVAFLAWPGEIFCELGMEAKQRSPFHPTYVIGYANGSIGYLPAPEAFPEGGYEVKSAAHLADNAGTVLVEESVSLLNGLAR